MAKPDRVVIDPPRHAHRAVALLLVALTTVAGWAVAPSGATAVRAGTSVAGALTKQTGPVVARTTRGPLANKVARATHQVAHVQRSATEGLSSSHGGTALVVLGALLALALLGRRTGVRRSAASLPGQLPVGLRRDRAPPTGVPTPA